MWLAAILALGAALRFATLGVQGFSDDELFTAWLAGLSFGDLIDTVPESEATPHLFYALEWLVVQAVGDGEVAMRVLPALFGTLTVAVVYAIGVAGASKRVGLAAAAFAAVNPFLVWYSQEARAYALLLLLVALGVLALVRLVQTGSGGWLAAWAGASALALATHYFALFLVLPEAVWLLWSGPRALRDRVAAVAAPGLVGAALLPLALHQRTAVGDPGGVKGSPLAERLAAVPKNFLVGFSIPAEAVLGALGLALAGAALVLASRTSGAQRTLAAATGALAGAGVLLPLAVAPFGFDYVSSRNVIAALVPLAVALGCGFAVGRAGAALLVATALMSVFVVIAVAAEPKYQRRDWKGAAEAIRPPVDGRVILFYPPPIEGPLQIYFGDETEVAMPRTTVTRELVLVALAGVQGFGPGAPRPPDEPTPPPPRGFRLAEERHTHTHRIVRYTAERPRPLTLREMTRSAFEDAPVVLLRQETR